MGRKFDSNNVIYIFFNKMVGGLYSILIFSSLGILQ